MRSPRSRIDKKESTNGGKLEEFIFFYNLTKVIREIEWF